MAMPESWMDDQFAARRKIAKLLGGRLSPLPQRINSLIGWPPSRHSFTIRLPEGMLIWYECWCNNPGVIEAKNIEARALSVRGFRSAFLNTQFSTRCVGLRRPFLLAPPESEVDFNQIVQKLIDSGFEGIKEPGTTVQAPPLQDRHAREATP